MAALSCRTWGRQLPISRVTLPNLDRDLCRTTGRVRGVYCFLAWSAHRRGRLGERSSLPSDMASWMASHSRPQTELWRSPQGQRLRTDLLMRMGRAL